MDLQSVWFISPTELMLIQVMNRDGTGATKSQIVRTPLRVFYDCVGKPEYIVTNEIFFYLKILALP